MSAYGTNFTVAIISAIVATLIFPAETLGIAIFFILFNAVYSLIVFEMGRTALALYRRDP